MFSTTIIILSLRIQYDPYNNSYAILKDYIGFYNRNVLWSYNTIVESAICNDSYTIPKDAIGYLQSQCSLEF